MGELKMRPVNLKVAGRTGNDTYHSATNQIVGMLSYLSSGESLVCRILLLSWHYADLAGKLGISLRVVGTAGSPKRRA